MKQHKTILLDPPWLERGGGKIKRGADKHYPLMKKTDILETLLTCPHWQNIAPNAHMYMWTTNSFLKEALWLMDGLGFRYVTNVVWIKRKNNKIQKGIGQYFRGSHELLLFGTRGKKPTEPKTEAKNISSVILAERGRHSKKPEASYDLIQSRSLGPYLEFFSRKKRDGWICWGNEISSDT
jgi:N6-adenosine-specific RNA methylase IME4